MKMGIYQHYKGMKYLVLETCLHSETLEKLVVYRALYGGYGLWVRPYNMFHETVEVDGRHVPRFKFLNAIEHHLENEIV